MRIYIEEHGKAECCENCTHYTQHYVRMERGVFAKCYAGHCMEPRIKVRRPDQVCERYERREQDEEIFEEADAQARADAEGERC